MVSETPPVVKAGMRFEQPGKQVHTGAGWETVTYEVKQVRKVGPTYEVYWGIAGDNRKSYWHERLDRFTVGFETGRRIEVS